jgi:hypothetical protein
MSSAISPVRAVLESYVAGRVKAERVVEAVAAAYYGEGGRGKREGLKPLMDIIERAHPGVIELAGSGDKPGFAVRLAERPFPKECEPALRAAVETVLVGAQHAAPLHESAPSAVAPANLGFVARLFGAIRRLFTAST